MIAPLPALRPREIAQRLGVKMDSVLTWIHSAELRAVNVAARQGKKPRWRILESDLAAFLASRAVQPPAPPVRRRRKDPLVTSYF